MSQEKQVPIPLSKSKVFMIQLGGCMLMGFIVTVGTAHGVLGYPLLTKMGVVQYFSTMTVFATLGASVMNPVGGKLADIFGRRNVILAGGLIALAAAIGAAFVQSFPIYMACRVILSVGYGAFQSAPYVILTEICEPKDIPKGSSYVAISVTISGFVGAMIAGVLNDAGHMTLGLLFPVIFLIAGLALIMPNYPNRRNTVKVSIDMAGITLFSIALIALMIGLNFGPKLGWSNPLILIAFAAVAVSGFSFVKVEGRTENPFIALRILKNKKFLVAVFVGFSCFFYSIAQNTYGQYAVLNIMGGTTTQAGSITLYKTIICMFLPAVVGAWAAKSKVKGLRWKFMALATLLFALPFLPLMKIGVSTSIHMLMVCAAVTGIADAFRACMATPTCQYLLDPADISVGTGLVLAFNTIASPLSSAVAGIILDTNLDNPVHAVRMINGFVFIVSIAGFLLAVTLLRKYITQKENESAVVDMER